MTVTSIREVAKAAGTSSATVSRVLNHDASFSVSSETATRVWTTAERLGYLKPSPLSQTIQIVTTQTHAMEINDPYFRAIRLALEGQVTQQQLKIGTTIRINQQTSLPSLQPLAKCGGVIVIGGFTQQALQKLAALNHNLVVIDDPYLPPMLDGVYADLFGFTQRLVTQLYQHFLGPIAFVGGRRAVTELNGKQVVDDQEVRYQAYLQATKAAKQPALAYLEGWAAQSGEAAAAWFLQQKSRPKVVVVASDPLAIGFIHRLFGQLTPQEFPKVVSFDDSEMAAYTTPSLSSVKIPVTLFGINAIRLLSEKMAGTREFATRVVLEPKLIYRDSLLATDTVSNEGQAKA